MAEATLEQVKIRTSDDYVLTATQYGQPERARLAVVVAGAIGVPQRYYRHFASHLAGHDFAVTTFDYRGIAASRSGSLRGFRANLEDWAERDFEAVSRWVFERSPSTAVVGHSFGGHAFGLISKANAALGLYTFGSGAGHYSYMPGWEGQKVRLMWALVGPPVTAFYGYLPSRVIGLGEDLPLGVYRQWRTWCGHKDYFFADPTRNYRERFAEIGVPVKAIVASDDIWSSPSSVHAFMRNYTEARSNEVEEVRPEDIAQPSIGHMGYFRPRTGAHLWDDVIRWFEDRLSAPHRVPG